MADDARAPRLGARPVGDATYEFCIYAPIDDVVELEIGDARVELAPTGAGFRTARVRASAGERYRYYVGGRGPFADPCASAQPDGAAGDSALVDPASVRPDATWESPGLSDLVLYELHVGTFSDSGTFTGVIAHLDALRRLGIRAIELMPVGTFPGERGWGYDPLYPFAPHAAYGTPAELRALVEAAHRADLGVVLDVVYNHLGPGAEVVTPFAPSFFARSTNLWGKSIDYRARGVREWAIQNAEQWIGDYGVDGLRIDAAHAVVDDSAPHVLAELATRVHAINPRALVIAEMETGDLRPIRDWGHDAQWADELHHAVHALVTGEREGYYADYGTVADLAWALERPERERLVVCAQNHDQVGNRALGDRLHGARLRLAAFCAVLSPQTPMLFMGEEYDERHPFQYFTDHPDPVIAAATRDGRRNEFAEFSGFARDEIPDPQAMATFARSRLDRSAADAVTTRWYADLVGLRKRLAGTPVTTFADERRRYLRVVRGDVELAMNFSGASVDGVAPQSAVVRR